MDPNACADRLIAALTRGHHAKAREALDDFQGWLARGGFMPSEDRLQKLVDLGIEVEGLR